VVNSGLDLTDLPANTSRSQNNGTLYISYDAALDELYLSTTGPGSSQAWKTVSGLLQGLWGGAPLTVCVGGRASGITLTSGQAYLDDFVIETGNLIGPTAVNRFWSASKSRHFYTISEPEKKKLISKYSDVWDCEGVSYYAFPDDSQPGLSPIYRFWSAANSTHFYTISEGEKNKLITRYSDVWTYEGVAFYAYAEGQQPAGSKPVYRFWSPISQSHFYTMSEGEKNKLITRYSSSWTYETVAWYAFQ
jgi:hypothetical protein